MSEKIAVSAQRLTKTFKDVKALDDVTLQLESNKIYGLLGRNGAGKTTLMSILTGQGYPGSGEIEIFGHAPFEHDATLSRICFIRESQKYPDEYKVFQAFKAASLFFENWNEALAQELIADFNLPVKRKIKKLSRGQLSAVGVIIGLASRAEVTFFDEPYLGLDAVARQIFYDRLVEDFSLYPRTIVLSSHLIDEVANLLEHVIIIDGGRIVMDSDAESLQGAAVTVSGNSSTVHEFIEGYPVIHRDSLGTLASISIRARLSERQQTEARELGLDLSPVSLQQLVVRTALGQPVQSETTEGDEEAKQWSV
ncbi:ABC transporter ATP-binding protein [Arthrobacter sp. MYb211]|uniref:ABC transporter ATP-binding protein n=1 Tax=Micrococcaceae TaxID=1268 RepID=UPI000CFB71BA|nr:MULTISPECIES: ABC transporter ATP-binding protein [unclassified Arthrobacter]PQZ97085.1 ABC transporter ATP-binding protein [Arthrobacter sp. MYb224]PRA00054.1 ABC transporter ATP-binding protein [Arthrobacter sp. MYb229]PRA08229.1 ABC transporter ATP-binding protein [Arthrobacter sp. MYb221]PRB48272.1 ABC transporter ATP-binding protein [Arthrobacter sp. MYb216]PRC02845.1 ABC transporter ATP-binding protein [Arthrobacter sp. MYb211]